MGETVYSVNAFQAFFKSNLTALMVLGIGAVGILAALVQQKQGRAARLVMAGAGMFLLLAGAVMAALSLLSARSGTQTVPVTLDKKRVVEETCGDYGQTCKRYVLESVTASVAYDFSVPARAFEATDEGACYEITYYTPKGPFSDASSQYQRIENVIEIVRADPAACN